jgi:hypothetical protein
MTESRGSGISGGRAESDPRIPHSLDQIPDEITIPDDSVCVFVSGSLVAGWGHAASDVDLYVVTGAPALVATTATLELGLSSRPLPVMTAFGPDGVRYDVEYWTVAQVDELLEAVREGRDRDHALAVPLSYGDVDWFFRLSIGVAILGGEWLREAKQRLAGSALPVILAAREFYEADGFIEDALGLAEVGDRESAVLAARTALGHAVDGYLFANGSFSPGVKWRYRKLAALTSTTLSAAEYWRLETMRELDLHDVRPWVERVVEVCQTLMLEVDFS